MTPDLSNLTEEVVRDRIMRYFGIHELVGPRLRRKHGIRAWRFLDFRLLYALLIIRVHLGRRITVNSGKRQQRGFRSIVQQIVKNYFYKDKLYVSAHMLGKAVDFDVEGMPAHEVRDWILANSDLFPFKIRLEDHVSWVHLDVIWEPQNRKVYLFKPPGWNFAKAG